MCVSGQILLLEVQPTEANSHRPVVCIANTHILFNMQRGEVKLAQLTLLLAEMDKTVREYFSSDSAIFMGRFFAGHILSGDFNMDPHSPLYHFIRDGQVELGRYSSSEMAQCVSSVSGRGFRVGRRIIKGKGTVVSLPTALGVTSRSTFHDEGCVEGAKKSEFKQLTHSLGLASVYEHRSEDEMTVS